MQKVSATRYDRGFMVVLLFALAVAGTLFGGQLQLTIVHTIDRVGKAAELEGRLPVWSPSDHP